MIRYTLAGMSNGELSQLISKMVAENPDVKDQEIAAKLKVNISRSSIDHEALNRAFNELKAVRISPILAERIAVDEYSEYEYWYDKLVRCLDNELGNFRVCAHRLHKNDLVGVEIHTVGFMHLLAPLDE